MAANPYDKPLALTSPHMRGVKVKNAQWLLSGHNAWSDNDSPIRTYYGRMDGEYGPASAGAAKRAKFWLGYPTKDLNTTFGALLYNLLQGNSQLSSEYAARRKQRIEAEVKPLKLKALELAHREIGTTESPDGSNCQKYGQWYGLNCVPWCAIFVSWSICHVLGKPTWKYSYVPTIADDAARGRNGMNVTYNPTPGDLVVYDWAGGGWDHVAFFDHWVDDKQNAFMDCGGNTGPSDFTNGGGVLKQVRPVSIKHRFIRLTL